MNTSDFSVETMCTQNSDLREVEDVGRKIAMVGRQNELTKVIEYINSDEDIWIFGAPGNGRGSLVYRAAEYIKAKVLEIDCMMAKNSEAVYTIMFNQLKIFKSSIGKELEDDLFDSIPFEDQESLKDAFKELINRFQKIAELFNTKIVIIFHGFEHIYIWDKDNREWEFFLRKEIKLQTRISYVFIGTYYPKRHQSNKKTTKVIALRPLSQDALKIWVQDFVHQQGLNFNQNKDSINEFFKAVDGHFGNARALAKRVILICKLNDENSGKEEIFITPDQVKEAIKNLLRDLSPIFESLLLSLPENQLKILECLAEEHTTQPHKEEYIRKNSLMRGGSLQGAIKGLIQKGLIYDVNKDEYDYKLTSPLLALWIMARLKGDKTII
jgi:hypothetical protein